MKHNSLGKGDAPTIEGDPQDMGLNFRERHDHHAKLRAETDIERQAPKKTVTQVSSDRGTFSSEM